MTQGFLEGTPETLNHYTTLESLALILSNKTFAFTKLSCLNDPLEGKNPNFEKAEEFVFSSSWTNNPRDTLPMWRMYSGYDGLRLNLPCDLFALGEKYRNSSLADGTKRLNYVDLEDGPPLAMKRNPEEVIGHEVLSVLSGPDKVDYVNRSHLAEDLLNSPVQPSTDRSNQQFSFQLDFSQVGLTKGDDWSFEKEWRFRLPFSMYRKISVKSESYQFDIPTPKENTVFLEFREEALKDLKILTGPKFSAGQMVLLNSLLERYAPNAVVTNSEIKIR